MPKCPKKSRCYSIIKQAILHPDSFKFWDLTLLPGLFRCKIRKNKIISNNNNNNNDNNY